MTSYDLFETDVQTTAKAIEEKDLSSANQTTRNCASNQKIISQLIDTRPVNFDAQSSTRQLVRIDGPFGIDHWLYLKILTRISEDAIRSSFDEGLSLTIKLCVLQYNGKQHPAAEILVENESTEITQQIQRIVIESLKLVGNDVIERYKFAESANEELFEPQIKESVKSCLRKFGGTKLAASIDVIQNQTTVLTLSKKLKPRPSIADFNRTRLNIRGKIVGFDKRRAASHVKIEGISDANHDDLIVYTVGFSEIQSNESKLTMKRLSEISTEDREIIIQVDQTVSAVGKSIYEFVCIQTDDAANDETSNVEKLDSQTN